MCIIETESEYDVVKYQFRNLESFHLVNFVPITRTGKNIKDAQLLKLINSTKITSRSTQNLGSLRLEYM